MTEMRRRHVALVLGSSTGGIGRHVASVAAALTRRDVDVTVLGPAATDALFGFAATGARFAAVEVEAGASPVAAARAARALSSALRDRPVDVAHAHGLRAGLLAGLAAPRGVPLVVTWHNALLADGPSGRLLARLEPRVARRADVTLAASSDLLARAWRLGARDARPHLVAAPDLPAPSRPAEAVRAELGVAPGQPLLLTVARLHPQKGLDVLLDAARAWSARRPQPVLAVAGAGPLAADLAARAAGSGGAVRLLGPRRDVADLLAAADVVVLPSRWEARALVAQEALRAGRPLVATSVGGLPELVGDAARLVRPEDPAALAEAVQDLLDDPAAAAALGARGRARAETWPREDDTVRQIAAVYAELTGRSFDAPGTPAPGAPRR